MPPINGGNYLVEIADQISLSPEWVELDAWQRLNQVDLNPIEAQIINHICSTYRSAFNGYDKTDSPRPYYDSSKPRNENSIRSALRN